MRRAAMMLVLLLAVGEVAAAQGSKISRGVAGGGGLSQATADSIYCKLSGGCALAGFLSIQPGASDAPVVELKSAAGNTQNFLTLKDSTGASLFGITSLGAFLWSADTGLTRSSAGTLKITDGSTGYGSLSVGEISGRSSSGSQLIQFLDYWQQPGGANSFYAPGGCGTTISNDAVSALQVSTLNSPIAGCRVTFIVTDADGISVKPVAGKTLSVAGTSVSPTGSVVSTTIGTSITFEGTAGYGDSWIATSVVGTWTVTP